MTTDVDALVSLDSVYQAICKFRKETGQEPRKMYLTEYEIECLNREAREHLIAERERDLKGQASKEEQLVQTMKRFLAQRQKDGVTRINGELPRKQRQYMDSILKQVRSMSST